MIIICNNKQKEYLLKNSKPLSNNKYYTLSEFIKNLYFDYDYRAILYVIKKYNVKYDIAKEYLDNLIYVEDKKYNIEKLDFLVNLKKELIDNKLLIFNPNFNTNENIIIYEHLSKFNKYLLRNIKYTEKEKESNNYKPTIYEFNDIDDEVTFVADSISKLISDGVSINNIKLTNVSEEYIGIIDRIFSLYNLKINKHIKNPIISNIVGSTFYNNNFDVESIKDYSNTDTYNKIINILNKYVSFSDEDKRILIEHDLYNTYISNTNFDNEIEVVDYKNYSFEDEYVFMLGFNQDIIPITYKDEDYINDSIKLDYMDTTLDKNIDEEFVVFNIIQSIKNLTITYKLHTSFNTYYKSNLLDRFELSSIPKSDTSYSKLNDELRYSYLLDNYIKYGEVNEELKVYNSNYDIPYNTYSNKFTGLSKDKLNKFIKGKDRFNLSYSSMDNYNRCSFRFYIEKILELSTDLDKFTVTLGSIYHFALEKALKGDKDIERLVSEYVKDNDIELTNSNKFFIGIAIKNIKFVLSVIEKQNSFSKLDKINTEKFVRINLKDNINFVGFIDKILYKEIDDYIIASIIDYKTYVKKPDLSYIESGIGLQLPVYMYLAKNAYKNIRFVGFYLQNITLDNNKTNEEKEDSLKLIGYTNSDTKLLEEFDYNYKDSSVIKGIKVNKDGNFSSSSLSILKSDEKINEIIKLTEEKIKETLNNILDSKFDINPKYDKSNLGCEFCDYRDICFMKDKDFVRITSNNEFGGDTNELD